MNNRTEDNIPTIVLDKDDVAAYKNTQQGKPKTADKDSTQVRQPVKAGTSSLVIFSMVVIYATVAGGGWWFYQEDLKSKQQLSEAESRIVELENQLSATGEEMGESTIAMKAKLEGLIKKTDTLWKEMDKLWASAWRKNQAQIKTLVAQNKKQAGINENNTTAFKSASGYIKDIQEKQTETEFNLAAMSEKLDAVQNLQSELRNLSSQYATLEDKSSQRDKSQLEVATSLNQLEMSVNALVEKVERLQQQTRVQTPVITPAG